MRNFLLFQAHCVRHVRSGSFSIWDVTWRGAVRLGTPPGPTAESKDSEENRTEYEPGAGQCESDSARASRVQRPAPFHSCSNLKRSSFSGLRWAGSFSSTS